MSQELLPASHVSIPGVGSVMSGVALRGENLPETVAYARDNSFRVYDSLQINRVAEFTRPESPDKKWVKQQAKALDRKRESIEEDYSVLRGDVWERYWVRGSEILALNPHSDVLVNIEGLQSVPDQQAVLITGYRTEGSSPDNFVVKGGRAEVVDWLRTAGEISPALRKKLGAKFPTYVHTNPDLNFQKGLRALPWHFRSRADERRVSLHSAWGPWDSGSYMGSLLGRLDSEVPSAEKRSDSPALTQEEWAKVEEAYKIMKRFAPGQ